MKTNTLSLKEKKLLNAIKKEKSLGLAIPTNHPINELSKKENERFKKLKKECKQLEKKKLVVLVMDDKHVSNFVAAEYYE